jgi:hypothetical protein
MVDIEKIYWQIRVELKDTGTAKNAVECFIRYMDSDLHMPDCNI